MDQITLNTTGTQSWIYFGHLPASMKWPEKRKYRAFIFHFKLVHFIFKKFSKPNSSNGVHLLRHHPVSVPGPKREH